MRVAPTVVLDEGQQKTLEQWARGRRCQRGWWKRSPHRARGYW